MFRHVGSFNGRQNKLCACLRNYVEQSNTSTVHDQISTLPWKLTESDTYHAY